MSDKQTTINNKQPANADALSVVNAPRFQERCLLRIDDCSKRSVA